MSDSIVALGVALVSGYLAVVGWIGIHVDHALHTLRLAPDAPIAHIGEIDLTPSTEPTELIPSPHYETGGPIPRILLTTTYQGAAVAATIATSGSSTPSSATSSISAALANIFCAYVADGKTRATSGSGIFIDPKGIILTNAHVAQFLMLGDAVKTRCVIRQGNPARPMYDADLLYISYQWVRKNASLIDDARPMGTGEHDFALLYVTHAENGELPTSFPFVAPSVAAIDPDIRDTKALAAGYPAEIMLKEGVRAHLTPHIDPVTVSRVFTFDGTNVDLVGVSTSTVGEEGSSGGPIISPSGSVIGLIVTKGNPEKDGAHSLRAITTNYIDRTITKETGYGLAATLQGDIRRRAAIFRQSLVPFLSQLLRQEITHQE